MCRASCVVRRAPCVVRRASCVVRRASCVARRASYHVGLRVVDALLEALGGHPLDGQLRLLVAAAVVLALVDVARQTEVSHLHVHVVVQPAHSTRSAITTSGAHSSQKTRLIY